jgi:hypothetical protein
MTPVPHRAKDLHPRSVSGSPFLNRVSLLTERVQHGVHPFDIPLLANGLDLRLSTPVTFLVGENGSGKSTLLEALAWAVGVNAQGGSRDHQFAEGPWPSFVGIYGGRRENMLMLADGPAPMADYEKRLGPAQFNPKVVPK